jgi:acetyl esterase/lipase
MACALALVLFVSPVIRAYHVAKTLNKGLEQAFIPLDSPRISGFVGSPFQWWQLFNLSTSGIAPRTLTYGSADGAPLTLDLYAAQRPGLRPCVVVIHGGSWHGGDSRQLAALNSRLAGDGYVVAAVNYRLAPRYKSPVAVDDVDSAIAWLHVHAAELSIDSDAFVLLGRSAGAQIALLSAYAHPTAGLRGVIDFYGPADMVWGYQNPSNPLVLDSRKVMADYLGGSFEAVPQNYHQSSPIEYVSTNSVPTLIIHGQQDVLVAYQHSRKLSRKLADSGIRHYILTLPWATHGFDYTLHGPGGQLSTFAVERFLQEVAP